MVTLVALADPIATAALSAGEHEDERSASPRSNAATHEPNQPTSAVAPAITDTLEDQMATAVLGAREHAAESSALRLSDLPVDVLQELYARVPYQFVLKLVCRALRAAGPKETEILLSVACRTATLFRWALRIGCPFQWNATLSHRMARHGAVNALSWARTHALKWDSKTCMKAAKYGHLAVLQLVARERPGALAGWSLDRTMFNKRVFAYAAGGGHMGVIQWLCEHQCPWDEEACLAAARFGHLEVLQWLRARDCPWNMWCLHNAAWGGHTEVVVWARTNGCKWSRYATMWAARNGHLETLQVLRRMGCRWDEQACMWAAREGRLEVLKYLRTGDGGVCPWDEKACMWAAKEGRLEVLQYLRTGDGGACPWDSETCWAAAVAGHLEVLQWARANGCEWKWTTWAGAALTGQVHVLRWLRANGCPRRGVSVDGYAGGPRNCGPNHATLKYFRAMHHWDRVRQAVAHRATVKHWAGLAGLPFL